jgi:hypothetical protein
MGNRVNCSVTGFTTLDISSSVVKLLDDGLASSLPAGTKSFQGHLETADIRVRMDGSNASATVGELVLKDGRIALTDEQCRNATFIRDASTDAKLQGHFYSCELSEIK